MLKLYFVALQSPLAHDICVQPLPGQPGAWLVPKAPLLDANVEKVSASVQGWAIMWSLGCVNAAGKARQKW